MRIIKLGILGILFILMNACETKNNISKEIDILIKKDSSLYSSLISAYQFKYYEDGVGPDLSMPIKSDSIIILKNANSEKLNLEEINKGKCLLLDSSDICNISFKHDRKEQVMRSFLKIVSFDSPEGMIIEVKNWVPQFDDNNLNCIELESTTLNH